jgi:hypothetical protein
VLVVREKEKKGLDFIDSSAKKIQGLTEVSRGPVPEYGKRNGRSKPVFLMKPVLPSPED